MVGDASTATMQRESDPRLLAGLGGALLGSALLMLLAPSAVVAVLFVPPVSVLFAAAFATGLGAIVVLSLKLATGRRHLLAGVLAAIAGTVAAVAVVASSGQIPLFWVPVLGVDLGAVPAAFVAVGAAAVVLPRWWVRLAGAALVVLVGGLMVAPQIGADLDRRAAEAEAGRVERDRLLEVSLDANPRPVVTEWEGASEVWVRSGSTARALYTTAGGGALLVETMGDSPEGPQDAYACWLMDPAAGVFDETVAMDDFAGRCEEVAPGRFRLVDGSAIAETVEGGLVIVKSAPEFAADLGAHGGASSEEVLAASRRLRLLTRAEFREVLLTPWTED
ncbi:MAG: hypothetical protein QM598_09005 [Protaetiibacter sp.]